MVLASTGFIPLLFLTLFRVSTNSLEVNSSPGFLGIEEAVKESVTKVVLEKYMDRNIWRKSKITNSIFDPVG